MGICRNVFLFPPQWSIFEHQINFAWKRGNTEVEEFCKLWLPNVLAPQFSEFLAYEN